jgi:hypothetical protein
MQVLQSSFPLLVPLLPITSPAGVEEQADVVGRRWCCRCRRAPRVACEERGNVYLHLLSPGRELCIPFSISFWMRKPEGTVASGRQNAFASRCWTQSKLDSKYTRKMNSLFVWLVAGVGLF